MSNWKRILIFSAAILGIFLIVAATFSYQGVVMARGRDTRSASGASSRKKGRSGWSGRCWRPDLPLHPLRSV